MKYVILIHSNPQSRQEWASFTPQDRAEGLAYYASLVDELQASGELIVTEALADPSLAKRVAVRDGQPVTTDGPFAEAKEHLAGFFLLDVDDGDRALAIAARIPEAEFGLVEVRPVMGLSDFEI